LGWDVRSPLITFYLSEICPTYRNPRILLDGEGRGYAALAGRPKGDPSWDGVVGQAAAAMAAVRDGCRFNAKQSDHRRGSYPALAVGASFGGGQKMPGNLAHSKSNRAGLSMLLDNPAIKRIAGFGNSAFAWYAPKMYRHYSEHLGQLYRRHPGLQNIFKNSIFPAATFNFGPQVETCDHTDSQNVSYGLCAISALGDFDPTKGGHLILFDVKLAIEFPPGSTILIPSATMRHGNVKIGAEETRLSFTQYCAGGLLRWVRYGFQS
ncbi:hypothetical protein BJ138DRAFT_990643, partial [Hygrophoropsis aurantiaca]